MLKQSFEKNARFASEIRQKQRQEHFRAQRMIIHAKNFTHPNYSIDSLSSELKLAPSTKSLQTITGYLNQHHTLNAQALIQLSLYIKKHYIEAETTTLIQSSYLSDVIAVLHNFFVAAKDEVKNLLSEKEAQEVARKGLELTLRHSDQHVGELVMLGVGELALQCQYFGVFQPILDDLDSLVSSYQLNNTALLGMLVAFSRRKDTNLPQKLILNLLNTKQNASSFQAQLVDLIDNLLINNWEQYEYLHIPILHWLTACLLSLKFPLQLKKSLLRCLDVLASHELNEKAYEVLNQNQILLHELQARILYDPDPQSKQFCVSVLIKFLYYMPEKRKQDLLADNPTFVPTLISCLSLFNPLDTMQILIVLGSILMLNNATLRKQMCTMELQKQLHWIIKHPVEQVSHLGQALHDECFSDNL